jgi:hypothetical protein
MMMLAAVVIIGSADLIKSAEYLSRNRKIMFSKHEMDKSKRQLAAKRPIGRQ